MSARRIFEAWPQARTTEIASDGATLGVLAHRRNPDSSEPELTLLATVSATGEVQVSDPIEFDEAKLAAHPGRGFVLYNESSLRFFEGTRPIGGRDLGIHVGVSASAEPLLIPTDWGHVLVHTSNYEPMGIELRWLDPEGVITAGPVQLASGRVRRVAGATDGHDVVLAVQHGPDLDVLRVDAAGELVVPPTSIITRDPRVYHQLHGVVVHDGEIWVLTTWSTGAPHEYEAALLRVSPDGREVRRAVPSLSFETYGTDLAVTPEGPIGLVHQTLRSLDSGPARWLWASCSR